MNLKELLREKKMKQKEVAKALGLSASAVSMWVKGNSSPKIATVIKLAEILDVSREEILKCFEK